jgi:choline dehydrogenase-like flavoprotein
MMMMALLAQFCILEKNGLAIPSFRSTRMHESPKKGIVDHNCNVHGIKNLYIASSSVFPTCGHSNPTLNIIALTLMLADNLKRTIS